MTRRARGLIVLAAFAASILIGLIWLYWSLSPLSLIVAGLALGALAIIGLLATARR